MWGDIMKKLLFITWSISYGYGTEKSLADVLNRMDKTEYDISILPLFKNSNNSIFNSNIKILDSLIDYTEENFNEQKALDNYYSLLANPCVSTSALMKNMIVSLHAIIMPLLILPPISKAVRKFFGSEAICVSWIIKSWMKTPVSINR